MVSLREFMERLGSRRSGYLQIKRDEETISLMTFRAPQEHYEEMVTPCDLKNAP